MSDAFTAEALEALAVAQGLVFPRHTLSEVVAAMDVGKNVMLTGAPGTGKTSLAYLLADLGQACIRCTGYLAVTASADWGIAETIGHYAMTPEGYLFEPGVFLQAIQSGAWLIVDELNRADFDQAFGPLFTVMANQAVTLPFKQRGHSSPISIVPADRETPFGTEGITVPGRWRMIATMNEFDKATLHRLSYALMRRFAFVEVESPPDHVIEQLVAGPGALVTALLPVRRFVELGPAIFLDAARYVARRRRDDDVTDSRVIFETFTSYFLPQLDRLDDRGAHELFRALAPRLDHAETEQLGRTLAKVLGERSDPLVPPAVHRARGAAEPDNAHSAA